MKPLIVISCPADTFSGYGARSRDIVLPIIKSGKYDVQILPQRWGSTPWGFLQDENPDHKLIKERFTAQLQKQPDVWIQITVPNEFQPVGKFNIGITAGIETTICAPQWIEGINRMNLTLVSSEHAKKVFENSKFERRNQQTQQVEGKIELTAPVEVLFEGANTDVYKKIDTFNTEIKEVLDDIKEDFNYLFVGHWLQGDVGQDRKDVGMLVKTFLETFKNKKSRPGLILKTQSATPSIMDREEILDKIRKIEEVVGGDLPNIYLVHGELTDEEINELYNHPKVKAHVSFTKGDVLEDVYKNYKKYVDGAKKQSYRSRTEFSLEKMSESLLNILENKVPKRVELKLPQLSKIELPKKPA